MSTSNALRVALLAQHEHEQRPPGGHVASRLRQGREDMVLFEHKTFPSRAPNERSSHESTSARFIRGSRRGEWATRAHVSSSSYVLAVHRACLERRRGGVSRGDRGRGFASLQGAGTSTTAQRPRRTRAGRCWVDTATLRSALLARSGAFLRKTVRATHTVRASFVKTGLTKLCYASAVLTRCGAFSQQTPTPCAFPPSLSRCRPRAHAPHHR